MKFIKKFENHQSANNWYYNSGEYVEPNVILIDNGDNTHSSTEGLFINFEGLET